MMPCISLYKFAGVIFEITQKPLYITPSDLNFLHTMAVLGCLPN